MSILAEIPAVIWASLIVTFGLGFGVACVERAVDELKTEVRALRKSYERRVPAQEVLGGDGEPLPKFLADLE